MSLRLKLFVGLLLYGLFTGVSSYYRHQEVTASEFNMMQEEMRWTALQYSDSNSKANKEILDMLYDTLGAEEYNYALEFAKNMIDSLNNSLYEAYCFEIEDFTCHKKLGNIYVEDTDGKIVCYFDNIDYYFTNNFRPKRVWEFAKPILDSIKHSGFKKGEVNVVMSKSNDTIFHYGIDTRKPVN